MNFNIHANIFKKYSKYALKYQNGFEIKKKIVNDSIRICIECGSKVVLIDKNKLHCNDCNSQFKIREDKHGCIM